MLAIEIRRTQRLMNKPVCLGLLILQVRKTVTHELIIRLEMKNSNMILTEKQQKHQIDHQVKLIKMNILQLKKYYLQIKVQL